MFAGNFAPRSWAFCDGQLLAISQNDALFSLFGTIYGGDGSTTFGLPDLRGRIPIHAGSGPGLSPRQLGSRSGQEEVTVTVNQLPGHTHAAQGHNGSATSSNPSGRVVASTNVNVYRNAPPAVVPMNPAAISNTGGSGPHNNLMPTLCVSFIVSLFGIYPSRN
jgi:microcystin-dependent protein